MHKYEVTLDAYDAASGDTKRVTLVRKGWTPDEAITGIGPVAHAGRIYREWNIVTVERG